VTVTLNLKPELEAGLLAQAQATGLTLEEYLQQLVEKELSTEAIEAVPVKKEPSIFWAISLEAVFR